MSKIRVSALQFATGSNIDENLNTCLRLIDQASTQRPDLMVLPEFCNHISWYENESAAWHSAVELNGVFLNEIAARARSHNCAILINVSLRRGASPDGNITVSSVLFDRHGKRVLVADKQALMGHENWFFKAASDVSIVPKMGVATLGVFQCRDGVTFETSRSLALRGATLFCDSLNSFAFDEAQLHVPARAVENKVFLVAANKVGPLIPRHMIEETAKAINIPAKYLNGAGESQIIAPDGSILARAPILGEAIVVADIDISQAKIKTRPDGSDLFYNRRPELYSRLLAERAAHNVTNVAKEVEVICYQPISSGMKAIHEVAEYIAELDSDVSLLVLPELFCINTDEMDGIQGGLKLSEQAVFYLSEKCREKVNLTICTSLILSKRSSVFHSAVLIDNTGLKFEQAQLHQTVRHDWSSLGSRLRVFDLSWGRVAMLCGDDACYPELAKVAALQGAHVLLIPFDVQESWEIAFGLLSRAAENRLCIVASSRERKIGSGIILTLQREFTIMQQWERRVFDGYINFPIITRQTAKKTRATIHPLAAKNKLMSNDTDLIGHRPSHLFTELTTQKTSKTV